MSTHTQEIQNPGPRRSRRALVSAIVAVLVLAVLSQTRLNPFRGDGGANPAAAQTGEMPPMPVDVETAKSDEVVETIRATGHIEAVSAVDLRPDEQGRITAILVREGQRVAAGTPLIRIDDAMLRAQAERAEADRDLADQQLARVRRLHAESAATPAELERSEAAARSAHAALALLQLQIERTTVRAPFGGVVGQRFVSEGDYVTTSSPLLTLQTTDPQRAVIDVPERHAVLLRPGQDLEFTVAAQPGRVFSADVEFIDPVVQNTSRTIVVKARARNRDGLLRPGMFIEARLATATRANAVVVPEDAIQPLRTANIVWAVVDGKASRRVVELGARTEGFVEVLSGVDAGEQVVVGGLERMQEGAPVAPRPRAEAGTPESGAPPSTGASN
jgi:membrane fusion protein, multidrug efflux system